MYDLVALYCSVDDVWKSFRSAWEKHLIDNQKSKRGPKGELSISEMMKMCYFISPVKLSNV